MAYHHIPAMLSEALHYLNCGPGKIYADCTLGGAGHAKAICEQITPQGILIGIDQDADAIRNAKKTLDSCGIRIHLFHNNFVHLPDVLSQLKIPAVDGILLDLGMSQHHLEASGRGFSFLRDEPLDMRMNRDETVTAERLVRERSESVLADLFKTYGEERWSARIAREIVSARQRSPIKTSRQLADIVRAAYPKSAKYPRIHPATRVFMALRIAVNRELERLAQFLEFFPDLLNPGGRVCLLSFHSLEDRLVKQRFRFLEGRCVCPPRMPDCRCGAEKLVRVLTRKVVRPTEEEAAANPPARSTRLRACEKL
jgi:16S rRNA (cytosine1402-N4)-methyltransferase